MNADPVKLSEDAAPTDPPAPRLLKVRELAERLGVSPSWVYQYRGPGRVKVGAAVRFDYDQVREHLSRQEATG